MFDPMQLPPINPEWLPGEVLVYRNLRLSTKTAPVYSIKDPRTGRVIAHTRYIALKNAKFIVQPGGRNRVRREGQRS